MDSNSEQEDLRKHNEAVRNKFNASARALFFYKDAISAKTSFLLEEALDLGPKYLATYAEYALHLGDMYANTVELSGETADPKFFDELKEIRLKAEAALKRATEGDYILVKRVLLELGASEIEQSMVAVENNYRKKKEDFGQRLVVLSDCVPKKGPNFEFPEPAWNNPLFASGKDIATDST